MGTYSDTDMALLQQLPGAVVLATLTVDAAGPVAVILDFIAAGKALAFARAQQTQNALIQAVTQLAPVPTDASHEGSAPATPYTRQELHAEMLHQITAGVAVLHDDAEAQEFKQFLLRLAEHVAAAAGRGLLGSGRRLTAEESAFLDHLRQILEMEPALPALGIP